LLHIKDRYLSAFLLGALVSQLTMLAYAPFIHDRMMMVLYFAMFALFIRAFAELQETMPKNILLFFLFSVVLVATAKLAYITKGYVEFYPIHKYNDQAMRQIVEQAKVGVKVETITLIPSNEDVYGCPECYIVYTVMEYYDALAYYSSLQYTHSLPYCTNVYKR
jgi:uncharacterized membrane protein